MTQSDREIFNGLMVKLWIESSKFEFDHSDNVTFLDLSNRNLYLIPVEVTELTNLTELNLDNNNLEVVPAEIGHLKSLTKLRLSGNRLKILPKEICQLTNLRELYLSANNLTALPTEIWLLKNLKILAANHNEIRYLPPDISRLVNLSSLYLHSNQLTEIPVEICQLTKLNAFHIIENPLNQPPPEIVAKGKNAVINYFQQLVREGKDYIYEAKLLIVGEGSAGKTTLAKKLENPLYELQKENTTKGIDVLKIRFPIEHGKQFQINIWDFGGQEIYHATHQFFSD